MPITYTNKDKNAAVGSPERTWRDVDANEVKTVVNAVETAAATAQSDVDTHEARTDNPHAVTAAQVGSPTTSEMNSAIASAVTGLWDDRGAFSAAGGAYPSTGGSGTAGAILKGDVWTISVAGTLPTGQVVGVGDTVRALIDTPGNTQSNWAITENNIGYVPENSANKDTVNGYPGLSSWSIKFRNLANTFTSLLQNAATTIRTYTFPDKDGTVAMLSDLDITTVSVTGAITLDATAFGKLHLLSGTSADYSVTLPTAVGNTGKTIAFKGVNTLTKVVTIDANSTELINQFLTRQISKNGAFTLSSDGTGWFVINEVGSPITYVPTIVGGTGSAIQVSYILSGDFLAINWFVQVTSTATTFTMSLPPGMTALESSDSICRMSNNGAAAVAALAELPGSQTNIIFYATANGGAWTASGTKYCNGSMIVRIQ